MIEMYMGQVNSPETTLTEQIDAVKTTITVADASALPTGPNIATIGKDINAETIHYTSKNGNILVGVTRGFQGIAKSWEEGAIIARNHTAYDLYSLITNIIALQTEKADKTELFSGKATDLVTDDSHLFITLVEKNQFIAKQDKLPTNGTAGQVISWDGTKFVLKDDKDTVYTHPSTHAATMISTTTDRRFTSDTEINALELKAQKGAANGYAGLDAAGKVPAAQLPSYVDDVLEYANRAAFPTTGETGKIYIDIATNKTYRWSGTQYTEISESIALGEVAGTAYPGDKGKVAYDHQSITNGNPHGTTKTHIGLGNVANYFNYANVYLTEAAYTALSVKDENTLYFRP